MLTKIGLENFKSWRHLDIDLAPITILFGTNSSGKSSILQSLLLLKQTVNNFDRKQHINFGGDARDYVDFGSYQDLIYQHDANNKLSVDFYWTPDLTYQVQDIAKFAEYARISSDVKAHYYISLIDVEDKVEIYRLANGLFFDEINNLVDVTLTRTDTGTYTIDSNMFDVSDEILYPYSCYAISGFDYNNEVDSIKAPNFVRIWRFMFETLIRQIHYLGPIRQYPERYYLWTGSVPGTIEPDGGNTIQTLIASEKQKNKVLQNVADWIVKLSLVDKLKVVTSNERHYEPRIVIDQIESALVDVGFGVSQVLPVITMLFSAPEGSIILLEQPELHLHPNAQKVLADLILHVAEERKLQLIVESHSEHLLRRLQLRIAEVEQDFANPDNIKMYFCEPDDGGSIIQTVGVDEYGQIANWPPNFFGDISGDLEAMTQAALDRRRQELTGD